jgi:hypothetical protein
MLYNKKILIVTLLLVICLFISCKKVAPNVSFEIGTTELSSSNPSDESPVGFVNYSNKVTIKVNDKSQVIDEYNCTLHGAGECGKMGKDNFDSLQLKFPEFIAGKIVLAEVIAGREIERAWASYYRYFAVLENDKLDVYRYLIPDNGVEIDTTSITLLKSIKN